MMLMFRLVENGEVIEVDPLLVDSVMLPMRVLDMDSQCTICMKDGTNLWVWAPANDAWLAIRREARILEA